MRYGGLALGLRALALAACSLAAAASRAHGPPLAVHDVLTWDAGAPAVVRLLRGAAVTVEGRLRFVCPERWGGPEAPLMVGAAEDALIFATGGFAWLDRGGEVRAADALSGLRPQAVRAVASDGGQIVAILGEAEGGALWRLAPGVPERVRAFAVPPDSVAIRGPDRWLVATEDSGRLTLAEVWRDEAGEVRESGLLEAAWRATPTLVWLGEGGLWLRGAETGGHRLDRVDVDARRLVNLTRTSDAIHGPIAVAGASGVALHVVVGGALHQVLDDALGPPAEGPRLFCLRGGPARGDLFACDATDLLRVEVTTGLLTPFLGLSDLEPPSLEGLDPTDRFGCELAWRDAAEDAGLATAPQRPEAEVAEPQPPEGCALGEAGLLQLLGALALARRLSGSVATSGR